MNNLKSKQLVMDNHHNLVIVCANEKVPICSNTYTAHIFLEPVGRSRVLRPCHSPFSCDYYVIFRNVTNSFNETLKQSYQRHYVWINTRSYNAIRCEENHVDMVKTALSAAKLSWKINCQ